MLNTFITPGVYTIETDLSQISPAPQQIGAGFIGLTQRGPAFQRVPFTSMSQFRTIFGGFNTKLFTPYAVNSYIQDAPIGTMVRVLGMGDPNNGFSVDLGRTFDLAFGTSNLNNTTASSYTANLSAIETLCILRSRQVAGTDIITDVSYTGTAESFTANIGGTIIPNLSLDNTLKNYIGNILGTDKTTPYAGDSATGVYVDAVLNYRLANFTGSYTGSAYGSLGNSASANAAGTRYVADGYQTAATPIVVSQPYFSGTAATVYPLFQLVSRTDGESSNHDVKISFSNIKTSTINFKTAPTFTVYVRDINDTDRRPVILEQFTCSMNQDDPSFIGWQIGDRYAVVTPSDVPGGIPETVYEGTYPNKSNYVRVIIYPGYNFDARPAGFQGPAGINPFVATLPNGQYALENDIPLQLTHIDVNGIKSPKVYLGFLYEGTGAIGYQDRLQGSFSSVEGASASRGFLILATTAESSLSYCVPSLSSAINNSLTSQYTIVDINVTGSATIVQNGYAFSCPLFGGFDGIPPSEPLDTAINDGTLSAEFLSALKIYQNPFECDLNLLVVPGIHTGAALYNGSFNTVALELCEDRQDCFYLMDIGQTLTPASNNITTDAMLASTDDAINAGAGFDSSYGATYYPWLRIFDTDNNQMPYVPPSVEICGVYAFTDKISQPWYAPAGFNRGSLNAVPEVRRRLTQTDTDLLIPARINPIINFVGNGPVVMGQSTLQQATSDLSNVNIRRMLIFVEKTIANLAKTQLFEFNDPKGQALLSQAINAFLQRVQAQRGLANFLVTIDSTINTPDVIDRNQLKGLIILQPNKTSDVIIFNYVLSPSGLNLAQVASSVNF